MNKIKEPSSKARKLVERALKSRVVALNGIKSRNTHRRAAVEQLLFESFTFREIGPLLGITGQMVGKLVKRWRDEV